MLILRTTIYHPFKAYLWLEMSIWKFIIPIYRLVVSSHHSFYLVWRHLLNFSNLLKKQRILMNTFSIQNGIILSDFAPWQLWVSVKILNSDFCKYWICFVQYFIHSDVAMVISLTFHFILPVIFANLNLSRDHCELSILPFFATLMLVYFGGNNFNFNFRILKC